VLYLVSTCFHTGPGVTIGSLGILAENDNAGSGLLCSRVRYTFSPPLASSGTYYIMVEGAPRVMTENSRCLRPAEALHVLPRELRPLTLTQLVQVTTMRRV
jgi:hypothetical protein